MASAFTVKSLLIAFVLVTAFLALIIASATSNPDSNVGNASDTQSTG